MGLNEVAEVGIVFEPLVMLLSSEPLIPETTEMITSKRQHGFGKGETQERTSIEDRDKRE